VQIWHQIIERCFLHKLFRVPVRRNEGALFWEAVVVLWVVECIFFDIVGDGISEEGIH
jgi:hypothetical protein